MRALLLLLEHGGVPAGGDVKVVLVIRALAVKPRRLDKHSDSGPNGKSCGWSLIVYHRCHFGIGIKVFQEESDGNTGAATRGLLAPLGVDAVLRAPGCNLCVLRLSL